MKVALPEAAVNSLTYIRTVVREAVTSGDGELLEQIREAVISLRLDRDLRRRQTIPIRRDSGVIPIHLAERLADGSWRADQ